MKEEHSRCGQQSSHAAPNAAGGTAQIDAVAFFAGHVSLKKVVPAWFSKIPLRQE